MSFEYDDGCFPDAPYVLTEEEYLARYYLIMNCCRLSISFIGSLTISRDIFRMVNLEKTSSGL
jgi:hypothetical protein